MKIIEIKIIFVVQDVETFSFFVNELLVSIVISIFLLFKDQCPVELAWDLAPHHHGLGAVDHPVSDAWQQIEWNSRETGSDRRICRQKVLVNYQPGHTELPVADLCLRLDCKPLLIERN